jgi:hypothetical protein
MRIRSLLLHASLLWLVLGLAHSQAEQPVAPIHQRQRNATNLSNLPPDARSSILAALRKAEGKNGNWVQQAALHASNGNQTEAFGYSVAVSGNTVVVGAPQFNNYLGEAYVFVKPAKGWKNMTEVARLFAPKQSSEFGYSVAICKDTIVIGEFVEAGQEAAYVYLKPAKGWKTTSKFTAELTANGFEDEFGNSVAVSGNTVVVGAHIASTAYVFVKPATGWNGSQSPTATLTALGGLRSDDFGESVAISGDTVAISGRRMHVPAVFWEPISIRAKLMSL